MSVNTTDTVAGELTIPDTEIEIKYTVMFYEDGTENIDWESCTYCLPEFDEWEDREGYDLDDLVLATAKQELSAAVRQLADDYEQHAMEGDIRAIATDLWLLTDEGKEKAKHD